MAVGSSVGVCDGVGVAVGVVVLVAVAVFVGVAVLVGVGVLVGRRVLVGVAVLVGVDVGSDGHREDGSFANSGWIKYCHQSLATLSTSQPSFAGSLVYQ